MVAPTGQLALLGLFGGAATLPQAAAAAAATWRGMEGWPSGCALALGAGGCDGDEAHAAAGGAVRGHGKRRGTRCELLRHPMDAAPRAAFRCYQDALHELRRRGACSAAAAEGSHHQRCIVAAPGAESCCGAEQKHRV